MIRKLIPGALALGLVATSTAAPKPAAEAAPGVPYAGEVNCRVEGGHQHDDCRGQKQLGVARKVVGLDAGDKTYLQK